MNCPPILASVDKACVQARKAAMHATKGLSIKNRLGIHDLLDLRATRYASVTVIGLIVRDVLSSHINEVSHTAIELPAINAPIA